MAGILQDSEGNASSIRLMSFIALIAAIGFGYIDVVADTPSPKVTFAFLIAAFCPKVLQAYVERMRPPKKEKPDVPIQ